MLDKISDKVIIILLDTNLELYTTSLVNNKLDLADSIFRDDKGLNLANRFENFWKKHSALVNTLPIYFLLGEKAGFTDTRIVSMWLRTKTLFELPKSYQLKLSSLDVPFDIKNLNGNNYSDILSLAIEVQSSSLIYQSGPRLGKNN